MSVLRAPIEPMGGVILLCGPPCSGKSTRAEALASQLGLLHVAVPTHEHAPNAPHGGGSGGGASAVPAGRLLPPAEALDIMLRAATCAADSLVLLECPSTPSLLPRVLMSLRPRVVLFVDATDRACVRRMQRRARQRGLGPLPDAHLAETLYAYRASDERIARAVGKRLPGRLCVLDDRLSVDESPAVLVEALLRADRCPAWTCTAAPPTNPSPPLLIIDTSPAADATLTAAAPTTATADAAAVGGGGHVPDHAAARAAEEMARSWGFSAHHAQVAGSDAAADAIATTIVRGMQRGASEGRRRVVSATSASLPVALRALQRIDLERSPGRATAPALAPSMCKAFVLTPPPAERGTATAAASAGKERALERAKAALASARLKWEALPLASSSTTTTATAAAAAAAAAGSLTVSMGSPPPRATGAPDSPSSTASPPLLPPSPSWGDEIVILDSTPDGSGRAGSGAMHDTLSYAADVLVCEALDLPRLSPLPTGPSLAASKQPMAAPTSLGSSGGGGHASSSSGGGASSLSLYGRPEGLAALDLRQLPLTLPPEGLPPTWLSGSSLRGLVVVSGADGLAGASGGSSSDERLSLCSQLAARLGAAHVALPALLRGQLDALRKTGSQLPLEPAESSLADTLRGGKLISAASTLRAVQTALHAAPEGLILVEHSRIDNPLESLVATIRPSLVLLVRPLAALAAPTDAPVLGGTSRGASGAGASGASGESTWAEALHNAEARQAYELRSLESLGGDAPQVRLCSGDVDEACELIFDFLCSDIDPAREHKYEYDGSEGDDSDDEEDDYLKSMALANLAKE